MKILVSNDDGYQSAGIRCLAKVLARIAEITVVAPDRDRSGASNSLTLDNPIRAMRMDDGFIRVDGTPTDCVHLAITGLLDLHQRTSTPRSSGEPKPLRGSWIVVGEA